MPNWRKNKSKSKSKWPLWSKKSKWWIILKKWVKKPKKSYKRQKSLTKRYKKDYNYWMPSKMKTNLLSPEPILSLKTIRKLLEKSMISWQNMKPKQLRLNKLWERRRVQWQILIILSWDLINNMRTIKIKSKFCWIWKQV